MEGQIGPERGDMEDTADTTEAAKATAPPQMGFAASSDDAGALPGSPDTGEDEANLPGSAEEAAEEAGESGATAAAGSTRLPPLPANAVAPEPSGDQEPGWRRPPLPNPSEKSPEAATTIPTTQGEEQIPDLLKMLECPVCMDVADRPPIYQCPEGHLLCEDCNSRLVDCPQCGHALMNSRNRTAEELASKLEVLRSGRRDDVSSSQKMIISVSAPKKVRKGLFAHVAYTINTKIDQGDGSSNKFSVDRRYPQVLDLHKRLVLDYRPAGIIVPAPPPKNRLADVAVGVTPNAELHESIASHMFEKRCVALDRYMKRLARHPIIRKDANFRAFVQEKDVPAGLKKSKSWSESLGDKLSSWRSHMAVSERDPWFQTRLSQLDAFVEQLNEMKRNLKDMATLKHKLHLTTTKFQRGLVSMLVSRPSRDNQLGGIIGEVVDCHKTMGAIHLEQSRADGLIVQLAEDYERQAAAVREVLTVRRRAQMEMQKAQKAKKNPLEEVEKAQGAFDKVSQTVRRELAHFDLILREEFEEAFGAYKEAYWNSLKMKNVTTEYDLE